jgi:hypothetical protein
LYTQLLDQLDAVATAVLAHFEQGGTDAEEREKLATAFKFAGCLAKVGDYYYLCTMGSIRPVRWYPTRPV